MCSSLQRKSKKDESSSEDESESEGDEDDDSERDFVSKVTPAPKFQVPYGNNLKSTVYKM